MDKHERNNDTTEEFLQHGGDLGLEYPVSERDRVSLEEAAPMHFDNVPLSPATLPENMPLLYTTTTEATYTQPESKKKSRKGLFIGIGGGAAAIALAAGTFGVTSALNNGSENTPPAPNPNSTSEPAPVETEAPTPSIPEAIVNLESLDYLSFDALPQSDRVAYVDYKLKANAEQHQLLAEGKSTWTEPSRDMTGQQIVDNYNYVLDESGISTRLDVETEEFVLDTDEAIKILNGAFYDTNASPIASSAYVEQRNQLMGRDDYYVNDQKYTVISESEIVPADDRSGNPTEVKEIVVETQLGQQLKNEFVYVEYINIDGEDASTWLLYDQELIQ